MSKSIANSITAFEESFKDLLPYIYGILGSLGLTISMFVAKQVSYLPTFQLTVYRSIALLCISYTASKVQGEDFGTKKPKINKFLIFRGFIEIGSITALYAALNYIPFSEAMVIWQICPTLVGILGAIFLGEKFQVSMLVTAVFCMVGVLFIAKPSFLFQAEATDAVNSSMRMIGIFWSLLSTCFLAVTQIVIRKISGQANSSTLVIYFAMICAMFSGTVLVNQQVQSLNLRELFFLFGIGVFSFAGQSLRNKALKYGKAGKVSMMGYSQIAFGFILDIFISEIIVDSYSVFGSFCIFCCLFSFIYQDFKQAKK